MKGQVNTRSRVNVLYPTVTSKKCLGREEKVSCYAVLAFSSSVPEIVSNKLLKTSFSSMNKRTGFWDSCESLTTKTSHGLCGLILLYTDRSRPSLVLM